MSREHKKKGLSLTTTAQKKRRRKDLSDDEDSSNDEEGKVGEEKHASDGSSPKTSSPGLVAKNSKGDAATDAINAQSESEMSVLVDEDPKPKKKSRKSESEKPKHKPKKSGPSKATKPSQQPADPDVEEIKRLQGWLVKCGIRKMWYRELAPYETSKAKIRHLKEMLADAGMTGRYSLERATQIRDERELKADLEAVQAGDKHWGKRDSEDEGGKPRRRLAKGLQELDFLNDDGEETD